ncbi:hypothetical protein B0H63DRAFT_484060 [Podospora didyma]|uniref:Uncharacterized protein n=1 Tax=Podospora didyma TaxID=330526 RepID=A0AAE0K8V6_9PEZI|nr:hypothetical protein B0H63DRAFT_484060 [Podospora didyma]
MTSLLIDLQFRIISVMKSMARQSVQTGQWTDHYTQTTHLLMGDDDAELLSSLIAVWLSLGGIFIFNIVKYGIVWLLRKFKTEQTGQDLHVRECLLPRDSEPGPRTIAKVLETSHGGRELSTRIRRYVCQRNNRHRILLVFIGLGLFGVYVSWIILGIISSRVQVGNAALWTSEHCGVWTFDAEHAGEGAATRADVRDRSKEARAGGYARRCYETSDDSVLPSASDCSFFYQPAIGFTKTTTYKCPFPDAGVCAPGSLSITFDTGLVDASQIGINDATRHMFRRSTTCAPLSIESRFVRNEVKNGTTTFYYDYGHRADGANYTFSSTGNPFNMLAPAYRVSAYSTSWYPEFDYWRPIPGLTPPAGSTLTLLFISALHLYYVHASSDPIFIADEKRIFEGETKPWWYKSDPRFRPLACIDNHQLCSPDSQTCWPMTDVRPENLPPSYWLMKLALEQSNIYDSIMGRLGSALIAQEKVIQSTSAGLPDNHWELEAARLFATSLARIQFDAWSIASGEDRDQEGYVDETPSEAGNLCGLFKFKSKGYKNLSLWALVGLWLVLPLLWVMSLEIKDVAWALGWKQDGRMASLQRRAGEGILVVYFLLFLAYVFLGWGITAAWKEIQNFTRKEDAVNSGHGEERLSGGYGSPAA